ncbi:MAG: hypothetical protein NT064_10560 [Proteobacteria bacterium]|nr:hypothetical protein [Pseudomonadota bacterium]
MKLSLKYSLVGCGALAVLSLVQWARPLSASATAPVRHLLGVLPNVTAAIAIPFVLLSIWADQHPDAMPADARYRFALYSSVTGVGLVAWEFFQQSGRSLVFDPQDLVATLVGCVLAWALFSVATPSEGGGVR